MGGGDPFAQEYSRLGSIGVQGKLAVTLMHSGEPSAQPLIKTVQLVPAQKEGLFAA
jgi:hypothetical protein